MNPESKPGGTVSQVRQMVRQMRFMEIAAKAFVLAIKARNDRNEPLRAHWAELGNRFYARSYMRPEA